MVETQFLDLPGGRLAYDDTGGDRPCVVCAPGLGDIRELYRFLRPLLVDEGFRVVTVDLRGHGESSVGWDHYSAAALGTDLVALVRHLGGPPPVVIGESMTAASAVWAAAEVPREIAGIVLTGPFTRDIPAKLAQRIGMRVAGRMRGVWLAYWSSLYPTHKPEDFPQYKAKLARMLREPGRQEALRGMLTASKADCEARMGEVTCPVLVIMGSEDPDFPDPAAEASYVAQRLSGRVVVIPGAGHYPAAEFPQATAEAIVPFLAQTIAR